MDKLIALILILSLVLAPASAAPKEEDPDREMQTEEATIQGTEDEVKTDKKKKPSDPAEDTEEPYAEDFAEETEVLPEEDPDDHAEKDYVEVQITPATFFDYFDLVESRSYDFNEDGVAVALEVKVSMRLKDDYSIYENDPRHASGVALSISWTQDGFGDVCPDGFDLLDVDALQLPPAGGLRAEDEITHQLRSYPAETVLTVSDYTYDPETGKVGVHRARDLRFEDISGILYLTKG